MRELSPTSRQWREHLAALASRKGEVEKRAAEDKDLQRLLLCFDSLALRGVQPEQAARTASMLVAGLAINAKAL